MDSTEKKNNYILSISLLISAVLIAGALIYSTGLKNTKTENQGADAQEAVQKLNKPQIDDSDVILGNPQAPVTIFIYSDYQCPFCGKFFKESELLIRKNYIETGKAKMIYKGLSFLGPESLAAAQAAECARDQGKYWEYHDTLFEIEIKEFEAKGNNENTDNLNKDTFKKIASDLKMNIDDFLSCYDSQKYSSEIEKDNQEAKSVMENVSTPTIFINDKMIQGAYPYNAFSQAIDEALNNK